MEPACLLCNSRSFHFLAGRFLLSSIKVFSIKTKINELTKTINGFKQIFLFLQESTISATSIQYILRLFLFLFKMNQDLSLSVTCGFYGTKLLFLKTKKGFSIHELTLLFLWHSEIIQTLHQLNVIFFFVNLKAFSFFF